MLRSVNHTVGFVIRATDGDIGKVAEFYLDDRHWAIRYLVVNTGNWLAERLVLISPISIGTMEWEAHRLDVQLTRDQIEKSPDIDTRKTVSRQHESDYFMYYGYPSYWDGPYIWGRAQQPAGLLDPALMAAIPHLSPVESHLRGTREVSGYHIEATDGKLGHVEDFIIDDETWAIRYLVVNTSNWGLGRKLLLSPNWVDNVSWEDSKVAVDLSLLTLKNSPEYDASKPITRDYERRLYDYYQRSAYWLPKVS